MTESITNRYRPYYLNQVVGHWAQIDALEGAISDRVSSQFLFSGPAGVGKTTLARITVRMLGCKPEDVEEVDAATETGIDNVRRLIDESLYLPLGGGARRAIIIDEVHALSANAKTALLKNLEEPPPHMVWCLCTTVPSKLDKTLISRCLHIALKELSTPDLTYLLGLTSEAQKMNKQVIEMCAREANGSARQALANLGICVAAKSREEAAELLRTAGEAPQAFQLAQLLFTTRDWNQIRRVLKELKDTNAESIRQTVRAYATKVVLDGNMGASVEACNVLEKFSVPFPPSDGISPVVLACANIFFDKT